MGSIWRRVWGSTLLGLSIIVTALLGFLSGAKHPPSRSTDALLVFLAAGFQFSSVLLFSRIGQADPGLARAAVRRLIQMGMRTHDARQFAERGYAGADRSELRSQMGRLSVELSWIEEGILASVEDWKEFHADALKELNAGTGTEVRKDDRRG